MTTELDQTAQPRRRANWMFLCSLIPVGVLGLAILFLVVSELLAQAQLNAEIDRLRQTGAPVDDASMTAWFQKHTHPEGRAAWNEAIATAVGLGELESDLPIVGTGKFPRHFGPNADWPDAAKVKRFLEHVNPLLERIHQAAQLPAPVQQSLVFQGIDTRLFELQNSRNLARLLQLDCVYACSTQDTERALKDLDSMLKSAKAFEWDLFLVGQFVNVACLGIHHGTIALSLETDLWRPEHLKQLLVQVSQPVDVQRKWKIGLDGERAMLMAALFDSNASDLAPLSEGVPSFLLSLNPSGKLRLLDAYRDLQNQPITPWMESGQYPPELFGRKQLKSGTFATDASPFWLHMFFPAESALVAAFQRLEEHRRLTRTAIGIKLYQQEYGTWPSELRDLARVGLSINDWTVPGFGTFGYRVQADHVQVWGIDSESMRQGQRIASDPPVPRDEADTYESWWLVKIR